MADEDVEKGLLRGEDGQLRCWWHGNKPDYLVYHDAEWGRPMADDRRLFEKICLEGFQSGLSWLTILRKRENFRAAFAGFDVDRVAEFGEEDIARLLADAGIVRHRGKIVSTINNAARARELRDEFGSLAAYFWRHEPGAAERPARCDHASLSALARRRRQRPCRRISRSAAGVSSVRQRSMPSCRRWGWSTTTSKGAACARWWRRNVRRSGGRAAADRTFVV
jgi:DNA-3-methyladenine glycosylase I